MIPVSDSLRSRTFPWVNYALIAVNFLVFFYELSLQSHQVIVTGPGIRQQMSELQVWIEQWGVVPCRLTDSCPVGAPVFAPGGGNEWIHLITSQFIHGGWAHILGNMLFLWIFGDNIEDAMGHVRYLIFYLIGGIIAGLSQVAVGPGEVVPSVGASGAIAAVLGAYLVTYPRASVTVVIPIIIIPWLTRVPAILMMVLWFFTQVVSVGAIASTTSNGDNVAYFAHIGGFIAGMILVFFFRGQQRSYEVHQRYQRYRW